MCEKTATWKIGGTFTAKYPKSVDARRYKARTLAGALRLFARHCREAGIAWRIRGSRMTINLERIR